jgi:hypothetical protein
VVLGLFVFPKLFGFAFLFLPFIWIRRWGGRSWSHDDDGRFRGSAPGSEPDGR